MIRTMSVPIVTHDESLESFAESIDCAIEEACASLVKNKSRILSISPVQARCARDDGEGGSIRWSVESGIVAIIVYETATQE